MSDILDKEIGKRVHVLAGDGKTELGYGKFVGYATLHIAVGPDFTIYSKSDGTDFTDEERQEMTSRGFSFDTIDNNPKIIMDDGEVKFGCQVWWSVVEEQHA